MNTLHLVQWFSRLRLLKRYAETLRAHRQPSNLLVTNLSVISRKYSSQHILNELMREDCFETPLVLYLALSALILSSHADSPQKGDSNKLLLLS